MVIYAKQPPYRVSGDYFGTSLFRSLRLWVFQMGHEDKPADVSGVLYSEDVTTNRSPGALVFYPDEVGVNGYLYWTIGNLFYLSTSGWDLAYERLF